MQVVQRETRCEKIKKSMFVNINGEISDSLTWEDIICIEYPSKAHFVKSLYSFLYCNYYWKSRQIKIFESQGQIQYSVYVSLPLTLYNSNSTMRFQVEKRSKISDYNCLWISNSRTSSKVKLYFVINIFYNFFLWLITFVFSFFLSTYR